MCGPCGQLVCLGHLKNFLIDGLIDCTYASDWLQNCSGFCLAVATQKLIRS